MEKVIEIRAGETKEVFYGVNVKGKVYFRIRTRDGRNAVAMWWTRIGPFFKNKHLGVKSGDGSVEIPGWSLNPRLKAKASSDAKILVSYNNEAAWKATFDF